VKDFLLNRYREEGIFNCMLEKNKNKNLVFGLQLSMVAFAIYEISNLEILSIIYENRKQYWPLLLG
jgi:hypothetical protein